ncbi:hypothetical protein JEG42_07535, partial [Anoxybacillus sp. LAT_11]|nr:hypothetical protein [Anoxybacillus sp. LAT_11]
MDLHQHFTLQGVCQAWLNPPAHPPLASPASLLQRMGDFAGGTHSLGRFLPVMHGENMGIFNV